MRGPVGITYRDIRVPGVRVGQVQDIDGKTGVTVVLFDQATPAGGHFCGHSTSTRQADSLRISHLVDRVDAFVFTGGSAYGLCATGGVLQFLENNGRGLPTRYGPVPICPTAALFDLGFGSFNVRPTAQMAMEACEVAEPNRMAVGSVGAGCGATVGKFSGIECAMKGGIGTSSMVEGDLSVQVIAACNGFGDVHDPDSEEILAGARMAPDSMDLMGSQRAVREGTTKPLGFVPPKNENTVLMAVLTNARLDKPLCVQVANRAEDGLRLVMRPALAPFDGDVIFCAATGYVEADVDRVGTLASRCVARAIEDAVRSADGFGILPSYSERQDQLFKDMNEED